MMMCNAMTICMCINDMLCMMRVHVFPHEPYDVNVYVYMLFFRNRMRGTRRSARLTGVPPENEGMDARPPALPRAMSCRSSREGTSRDPRRSFDVSRRETVQGGMSADVRGSEEDEQRRDGSLGMSMSEESIGESQGGAQASGFGYPPQYQPFPQGSGYLMGGTSV